MVNDSGQLYTMEGIAAGLVMLLTAYLILSTTSIYTPGDTHIPDMQLEQLGSDVLAMMDTPDSDGGENHLDNLINRSDRDGFNSTFLKYCNARTNGDPDTIHMSASVAYRDGDRIEEHQLVKPDETWTGRESAVRVTRWVQLDQQSTRGDPYGSRAQAVLVEVLLWRA